MSCLGYYQTPGVLALAANMDGNIFLNWGWNLADLLLIVLKLALEGGDAYR